MRLNNEIHVNKTGIRKWGGYQLDKFKYYVAKVGFLM